MGTDAPFPQPIGDIPPTLPVLPLKGTVVFPGAMAPLAIGEDRSIRLTEDVVDSAHRMVALVTAKDADVTEPALVSLLAGRRQGYPTHVDLAGERLQHALACLALVVAIACSGMCCW